MTSFRSFPPPPPPRLPGHRLRDGRPPAHCQCQRCRAVNGLDAAGLWALLVGTPFGAGLLTGLCIALLLEVAAHV